MPPTIDYPDSFEQSVDDQPPRTVRVNNLDPARMSNVMTLKAQANKFDHSVSESGYTRILDGSE